MAHGLSYSEACGIIGSGLKPVSPYCQEDAYPLSQHRSPESGAQKGLFQVAGPGDRAIHTEKTRTPPEFSGVAFESLNLGQGPQSA